MSSIERMGQSEAASDQNQGPDGCLPQHRTRPPQYTSTRRCARQAGRGAARLRVGEITSDPRSCMVHLRPLLLTVKSWLHKSFCEIFVVQRKAWAPAGTSLGVHGISVDAHRHASRRPRACQWALQWECPWSCPCACPWASVGVHRNLDGRPSADPWACPWACPCVRPWMPMGYRWTPKGTPVRANGHVGGTP